MPTTVHSYTLVGVDAVPVTIEVDLLRRLPAIIIVGMPTAAVRETAERVRSAILASGFEFPRMRIVVSVAPADLRRNVVTALDLPIAYAILVASGQVAGFDRDVALYGELSLSGDVRPVRGALAAARRGGADGRVLVGTDVARFAASIGGEGYVLARLSDLHGTLEQARPAHPPVDRPGLSMADVRGQDAAVGQLAVAAATRRPVVLIGPPGCGKTMLAARAGSLLPALTPDEAIDVATIHDAAWLGCGDSTVTARPFRAPHHTVSLAGLVGNAAGAPGEATLAHRGVLFLDELPEFPHVARETIGAVLTDRRVTTVRVGGTATLPADCWVIAASNPCPCGYRGHPSRPCCCSDEQVKRYLRPVREFIKRHDAAVVTLSPVPATVLLGAVGGAA